MSKLYLYAIKENYLSDFHKKYGWTRFSKIFPTWHKTELSKKNMEKYGYNVIVYTKQPLNKDIVEKYDLIFIDEVLENEKINKI
ncbi:MAG: hypothetical protein ACI4WW_02760 [Candidatus Coprovivens sp.]